MDQWGELNPGWGGAVPAQSSGRGARAALDPILTETLRSAHSFEGVQVCPLVPLEKCGLHGLQLYWLGRTVIVTGGLVLFPIFTTTATAPPGLTSWGICKFI